MEKRRTAIIGIKQTIRLEWMEKTANLLLAGLPAEKVRQELTRYLQIGAAVGLSFRGVNTIAS